MSTLAKLREESRSTAFITPIGSSVDAGWPIPDFRGWTATRQRLDRSPLVEWNGMPEKRIYLRNRRKVWRVQKIQEGEVGAS